MPDELTGAAAPVIRLRPDFRPTAFLARTEKSLLIAGDCEDGPAVAKLLTTPESRWAEKFGTEIDAYRTFAAAPRRCRFPPSSPPTTGTTCWSSSTSAAIPRPRAATGSRHEHWTPPTSPAC
nr:hypothetical protein [Streptomyces zingiberis]